MAGNEAPSLSETGSGGNVTEKKAVVALTYSCMSSNEAPGLLTLQEAAAVLSVSTRWLRYHWQEWGGTKIGQLKFFKDVLLQQLEASKDKALQAIEEHKSCKNSPKVRHKRERKQSAPTPARDDIGRCGAITRWLDTPCQNKAIKGQHCAKHGGPSINSIA